MTRLALVIFPESPGLAAAEAFRTRWDPLAAAIAAHITLVFPFPWNDSVADLRAHLQPVAERHSPFEIDLGAATAWEDEYVFLLARTGGPGIQALHESLYAAIPGLEQPAKFVPHLTVGRCPTPGDLATAVTDASSLSVRGTARAISVYRLDGGTRVGELDLPLGA